MHRLHRIIFFTVLAIPALLVLSIPFLIGGFVWVMSFKPAYDTQHPDYARYADVFVRLEKELTYNGIERTSERIDFAPLNGGSWKTVCLFGGYGKPIEEMRQLGAIVSDADVARMEKARHGGFRLYGVEESEAMIAYVDDDNRAHLIHFEAGIGAEGQHYRGCIAKPETMLTIGTP